MRIYTVVNGQVKVRYEKRVFDYIRWELEIHKVNKPKTKPMIKEFIAKGTILPKGAYLIGLMEWVYKWEKGMHKSLRKEKLVEMAQGIDKKQQLIKVCELLKDKVKNKKGGFIRLQVSGIYNGYTRDVFKCIDFNGKEIRDPDPYFDEIKKDTEKVANDFLKEIKEVLK